MLVHCYVLMICYLNSRVLGFSAIWIYAVLIINYQLILPINIKQCLYAAVGNMSIQLCHLGSRMHQITFNITLISYKVTQCIYMHWFTWMILLSFHIPKTNIRIIYILYLTGFPSLSTILSTISVSCFLKRLRFLAILFQLPVLVFFRPRLMLSKKSHCQYLSRIYRPSQGKQITDCLLRVLHRLPYH